MRVRARRTLREFWVVHPSAEQPLRAWFSEATAGSWDSPQSIKDRYRHASFVGDNRVVFNIGGNKFRLITHVNYEFGIVYIKYVGTHADYNRVNPETI